MKLIHVTPPEVNYFPIYSVEYVEKVNPKPHLPECWNQHGRTNSKFIARILSLETWVRYGRTHKRRVRVL